ncbi:hypothetical protein ACFL6I_22460, partial [candidate division KSB1 bacterium]
FSRNMETNNQIIPKKIKEFKYLGIYILTVAGLYHANIRKENRTITRSIQIIIILNFVMIYRKISRQI